MNRRSVVIRSRCVSYRGRKPASSAIRDQARTSDAPSWTGDHLRDRLDVEIDRARDRTRRTSRRARRNPATDVGKHVMPKARSVACAASIASGAGQPRGPGDVDPVEASFADCRDLLPERPFAPAAEGQSTHPPQRLKDLQLHVPPPRSSHLGPSGRREGPLEPAARLSCNRLHESGRIVARRAPIRRWSVPRGRCRTARAPVNRANEARR